MSDLIPVFSPDESGQVKLFRLPKIGAGLEGQVLDSEEIHPGTCLKLFHDPNCLPAETDRQRQIRDISWKRYNEYPRKLAAIPDFHPNVLRPLSLCHAGNQDSPTGYFMKKLNSPKGFEWLFNLKWRFENDIPNKEVVKRLSQLFEIFSAIHEKNGLVGDVKPQNVLMQGNQVFLADADSLEIPGFPCHAHTYNYLDPMICNLDFDNDYTCMKRTRGFSKESDMFGFAVIAFNALLGIGPFDGTYAPEDPDEIIPDELRAYQGISIRNPNVILPDNIFPLDSLPEWLIDYFMSVFESDNRAPIDIERLLSVDWKFCRECFLEHGREVCPICKKACSSLSLKPKLVDVSIQNRDKLANYVRVKKIDPIWSFLRCFDRKAKSDDLLHVALLQGKIQTLRHRNGVLLRNEVPLLKDFDPKLFLQYGMNNYGTFLATEENLFVFPWGDDDSEDTQSNHQEVTDLVSMPVFPLRRFAGFSGWFKVFPNAVYYCCGSFLNELGASFGVRDRFDLSRGFVYHAFDSSQNGSNEFLLRSFNEGRMVVRHFKRSSSQCEFHTSEFELPFDARDCIKASLNIVSDLILIQLQIREKIHVCLCDMDGNLFCKEEHSATAEGWWQFDNTYALSGGSDNPVLLACNGRYLYAKSVDLPSLISEGGKFSSISLDNLGDMNLRMLVDGSLYGEREGTPLLFECRFD